MFIGVFVLMLDYLQLNNPIFVIDPSILASIFIVTGAFLLLFQNERNETYINLNHQKLEQLNSFKIRTLHKVPDISAVELERYMVAYAKKIHFDEYQDT